MCVTKSITHLNVYYIPYTNPHTPTHWVITQLDTVCVYTYMLWLKRACHVYSQLNLASILYIQMYIICLFFAYCFLFSFNLIHIAFYVRTHTYMCTSALTYFYTYTWAKNKKGSSKAITAILRWVEFHMMMLLLRYCSAIEIKSRGRGRLANKNNNKTSGGIRASESDRIHLFYSFTRSFYLSVCVSFPDCLLVSHSMSVFPFMRLSLLHNKFVASI